MAGGGAASGAKAGRHFGGRPWHVFAFGSALGSVALFERVRGFRSGRRYLLCHPSPALDHLTLVALALLAGVFLTAVAGERRAAGDGRRATGMTAERLGGTVCDCTPQVHSATPGWFSW
ncbi:hypothetical protein ACFYXS_28600 [Streptomyces sp. NPDC002574]|uniref:hypothetical protein n=1 Tax=Streptomyces sp. NPDC002574 TaxID=3364652 RepID=UPI00369C74F6